MEPAEGVTPEYMGLSLLRFRAGLRPSDASLQAELKTRVLQLEMAPWYKELAKQFNWGPEPRLEAIETKVEKKLKELQDDDADAPQWSKRFWSLF